MNGKKIDIDMFIPYDEYIKKDVFIPHIHKTKKKKVCDDIICFDIEACNYFTDGENVYCINDIFQKNKYIASEIEKDFDKLEHGALPYIWQCSLDNFYVYGRELKDFLILLKYLESKTDAIMHIWIHNINYEYVFLREIISFDEVFFTDARKPLFATYHNFYFRCSYRLTNLSLAKWGQNNGIDKLIGDLDYYAMYTPLTILDKQQMKYCLYDLFIMKVGIEKYLDEYKHIDNIPLTQTGIVRKDIKALNAKNRKYISKCMDCQPKNIEEYKVQRFAFSGGLVLVNPEYCNKLIYDIDSYDKKSAYPFAMLQKFPATGFYKTNDKNFNPDDGLHHIIFVKFTNLCAKYNITPVSSSKHIQISSGNDLKLNNGKIIYAATYITYITELDYKVINMFYTFEMEILSHYVALSDYMDKHIIDYMLDLYRDKTLLKGGDPVIYLRKKEKLNCIYGMAATQLTHPEITEIEYRFEKIFKSRDEQEKDIKEYQEKWYKNVLPYSWGVYIAAYQRYFLMDMAMKVCINKLIYTDTDSLKGFYKDTSNIFKEENNRIINWTIERCDNQGIDYEKTCPIANNGEKQYLGIWEHDAHYEEIKILRAKSYAYKEDGKTKITIAGIPKICEKYMQSLDDLKEGLSFNVFKSNKNIAIYRDGDNPLCTFPDGYKNTNTCGVCIRPVSYKATLTNDFRQLLLSYAGDKLV